MFRLLHCLLFAALACLAPLSANAQDLASLIADQIQVDPSGRVTATGNVEIFYRGTRLTAQEVSYDQTGDRLTILGPIRITDEDGTVIIADQADLDRDLRDGVLVSARMVLNQQLQIAATEIARVDDRYTRMDHVVASTCKVCAQSPTPFWEIRASRVTHDDVGRQLYFENAQLRFVGVPIMYFPRFRLPDPTLKRATGALVPSLSNSSVLGTGVKQPYFFVLDDYRDLTLTPYVSTKTTTLEFGYRHMTTRGEITIDGALTKDDLEDDRAYLFANASHRLPRGFRLDAQFEFVSDPGYLYTYDYSTKDRLTNAVRITRVRDKDVFRGAISEFRTLRESEIPIRDTLTDQFIELTYTRELPELSFGGRTTITIDSESLYRPSSDDIDGRDVNRIGTALDWSRSWLIPQGIIARSELGLRVDAYAIGQDSTFDSALTRVVPRAAAELRWPFSRVSASGSTDTIEPILRFDISDTGGDNVPNEDSRIVEFDEANLFSFTRYPGVDGVEDGVRVAAGATWHHADAKGWNLALAFGRVANLDGDLGYGDNLGLSGDRSEWLVSGQLSVNENLSLISRSLFNNSGEVTLSETRANWQSERFSVGSSYVFAVPEPAEDRTDRLSEWNFDGSYALTPNWTADASWRYDFSADRAAKSGLGLTYRTECAEMALSLSRRFATSASVTPTTEIGFSVALLGVGSGTPAPAQSCRG